MEWFPGLVPSISRELAESLQQSWRRLNSRPGHDEGGGAAGCETFCSEVSLCPHCLRGRRRGQDQHIGALGMCILSLLCHRDLSATSVRIELQQLERKARE